MPRDNHIPTSLDVSVELDYSTGPDATLLLQIEAAATPEQRVSGSALQLTDPLHLSRVPAEDGVGERAWVRVAERLTCRYAATIAIDRPDLPLDSLGADAFPDLPAEAVRYLFESRFIPAERVRPFVEAEFGGLAGGARIDAIRGWVNENLSYVRGSSDETTTAVDTFLKRQGVCRDYAHLVIAMARASCIPARMASVYAPDVEPQDFHAVAQVWLQGSWRIVDATGMARPSETAIIGVGRDAADIAFLLAFGQTELKTQTVSVARA